MAKLVNQVTGETISEPLRQNYSAKQYRSKYMICTYKNEGLLLNEEMRASSPHPINLKTSVHKNFIIFFFPLK